MIRTLNLVAMVIALVLAGALYVTKNDVKHAQTRLAHLQEQVRLTREAVHLLENEEAYLERPDRLVKLAKTHLGAVPVTDEVTMSAEEVLAEMRRETVEASTLASVMEVVQ